MIIESPKMQEVDRLVRRVAASRISVLILGETGVGKELTARSIHDRSPRHAAPFVRLNCAALSESLIDSELFGYEKGAFTGAVQAKAGLIEAAEGGTVFLDEVGEMPLQTQVKLLRVLEEREVLRVGGLETKKIDVRVVSATNRDLKAEIAAGTFREDLYFRLNGIAIHVPPLRERTEEILALAKHFIERTCERDGVPIVPLGEEAQQLLLGYAWPGNVRELRNAMERAVLLAEARIEPEHLPPELHAATFQTFDDATDAATIETPGSSSDDAALDDELAEFEREQLMSALVRMGGNQTEAAERLKISRRTLLRRLDEHGLRDDLAARGLLRGHDRLDVAALEDEGRAAPYVEPSAEETQSGRGLRTKVGDFEREKILEALKGTDGQLERAADTLGVSPRVLRRRIAKYFPQDD